MNKEKQHLDFILKSQCNVCKQFATISTEIDCPKHSPNLFKFLWKKNNSSYQYLSFLNQNFSQPEPKCLYFPVTLILNTAMRATNSATTLACKNCIIGTGRKIYLAEPSRTLSCKRLVVFFSHNYEKQTFNLKKLN